MAVADPSAAEVTEATKAAEQVQANEPLRLDLVEARRNAQKEDADKKREMMQKKACVRGMLAIKDKKTVFFWNQRLLILSPVLIFNTVPT